MNPEALNVIYEDNHLLVVFKPAGLATMGLRKDKPTLLSRARQYIKQRYGKPGNVYLGVVSRLDAPVTGLVLFARTSKAARRLTDEFRRGAVKKAYWAIVEGAVGPCSGICVDWIGHDQPHRRMHVVDRTAPGAKQARLTYRRLETLSGNSLLEVYPETGRKHQIRVQLAHRGYPVLGDRKYGARRPFPAGIALHARRLEVDHPVKNERLLLEAPVPDAWGAFGVVG